MDLRLRSNEASQPFPAQPEAAVLLPQGFVARRSQILGDMLPPRFAPCGKIPRRAIRNYL